MNQDITNMNQDELLALKYFILRDSYNMLISSSSGRYKYDYYSNKLTNYCKEKGIKIDCLKIWISNFSKYENVIYSLVTSRNYHEEVTKYYLLEDRERLHLAIKKLLLIFSINKSENQDIYKRLLELEKRLDPQAIINIFKNINNPFDNMSIVRGLNRQINDTGKANIKTLTLSTDKPREDKYILADDWYKFAKEVINEEKKYYMSNFLKGNRSLITDMNEYNKIGFYVENNLDILARKMSKCIIEIRDCRSIYEKIPDECVKEFICKVCNLFSKLDRNEHYGKDKYGKRFGFKKSPKPNIFLGNDARIYINTSDSLNGRLFLYEYIKRCRNYGIDYDMKGLDGVYGCKEKDMTIFYTLLHELPIRIKILDDIEKEKPELVAKFGTPPLGCGRINNSYYGISHIGPYSIKEEDTEYYGFQTCLNKVYTYSNYFNYIAEYAYYCSMAKLIFQTKLQNKIDDEIKPQLKKFTELKEIKKHSNIGYINHYTIDDKTIGYIVNYLSNNNFKEELVKMGYSFEDDKWLTSFRQNLQAMHNIAQGYKIDAHINPAINRFIMERLKEILNRKKTYTTESNQHRKK